MFPISQLNLTVSLGILTFCYIYIVWGDIYPGTKDLRWGKEHNPFLPKPDELGYLEYVVCKYLKLSLKWSETEGPSNTCCDVRQEDMNQLPTI